MTDYTPVDCGLHSEYELAIMHRDRLKPGWHYPAGEIHLETVIPVGLSNLMYSFQRSITTAMNS